MKIAIEVGPQNITIVRGTQTGNNLNIKNALKIKTPPFVIKDGQILNVDMLFTTINNALLHNKLKATSVTFNINSTSIITREFIIPKTNTSQAIKMVTTEMFQARNTTTEYCVDYAVTDVIKEGSTEQHKVLAVAVPQDIVAPYVQLCNKLGFMQDHIDMHFNAIYKTFAIQPSLVAKEKPIIIANIGTSSAVFLIVEKGKIVFSKTISLNISKYMNLTNDKVTIDYSKIDLINPLMQSRQKLVDNFVYDIAQEISKIIQFSFSRSSTSSLGDVFLGGAFTEVGGIEERIASMLDTDVKIMSKPFCVKTKLNFKYSQFASTIGGLIRLK